jgi:GxxExxY protein
MLHEELTGPTIAACIDVSRELGAGFTEAVYHNALLICLSQRGLSAGSKVPLKVWFRGEVVGDFVADIVLEGKVIIELKAVSKLLPEHQAQLINYLQATGLEVGLLVNFGTSRAEVRRCERRGGCAVWTSGTPGAVRPSE